MGSIRPYESAKGRRYSVRWRDLSQLQHEKRGFRTRKEAQRFAATIEIALFRGAETSPIASRITIGELATVWLANKQQAQKPSSFAPIRTAWRVYVEPRWARTPIALIRPSHVETWIRELGQRKAVTVRARAIDELTAPSASVVLRAVGVLAGILDMAVRDGRIQTNPARLVTNLPRKQPTRRRRYLSNEEVFRFAYAAPDDAKTTLILTLAYTGIRWGEAVALTVEDIDLLGRRLEIFRTATEVDGVIHVGPPKSWAARRVPIPAFLESRLGLMITGKSSADLLFEAQGGGFIRRPDTARNRQSWWLSSLSAAGLPHLTPHGLRHTAASLAVSAGANVKALQRMLGHKSAAMTLDTYAGLFEEDLAVVGEQLNERAVRESGGTLWAHER